MARTADGFGVFGRRFASDGSPIGGEFQLNAYTIGSSRLRLSLRPTDDFVAAWQSQFRTARALASSAVASTAAAWPVPRNGVSSQPLHHRRSDPAGGPLRGQRCHFVVVWASEPQDGDFYGVFGRAFDAQRASGDEFQINTTAVQASAAAQGGGRAALRRGLAERGQDGVGSASSPGASSCPHSRRRRRRRDPAAHRRDADPALRLRLPRRHARHRRGRPELHAMRRAVDRGVSRFGLTRGGGCGSARARAVRCRR